MAPKISRHKRRLAADFIPELTTRDRQDIEVQALRMASRYMSQLRTLKNQAQREHFNERVRALIKQELHDAGSIGHRSAGD